MGRRLLLPLIALGALTPRLAAADMYVYFGSHSFGPGIGFSLAHFDTENGQLSQPRFLLEAREPAFFVIHPDGRHLYTCNSGEPGGVSAYAIDPRTGALTLINRVLAGGGDTSFICLDRTGRYALAANYDGGNVSVFALRPDGGIGDWTAFVQHHGSSVNRERQAHAYAHSIITDPTNRFALVADLGLDKVFVYRFDDRNGSLTPNAPAFVTVAPGSGPRHVRFHPNGRWVYLVSEMASTVTGFNWSTPTGTLSEFQTISTLPRDYAGTSMAAEILVHPNGRFLYASNRGLDSIAVVSIDGATGHLGLVENVPSGGSKPRNFAFDPSGKWIICTNTDANNAVVFSIDEATGRLTRTGAPVSLPSPYCERFLPVPAP